MGLGKGQKIVIDILIINGNKRVCHHVALACLLCQDVAKIVVCERSRSRRRMSDRKLASGHVVGVSCELICRISDLKKLSDTVELELRRRFILIAFCMVLLRLQCMLRAIRISIDTQYVIFSIFIVHMCLQLTVFDLINNSYPLVSSLYIPVTLIMHESF